ncbi:hypothetical protein [Moraxella sp.]|uniref:hypothetical protein n=1 Tax=Moraxella sp. TaxID=479 RepID=UPI002631BD09|nr:hypothetical protein [Moraxella sp.]MCP3898024.1 hypothetical protein [Moraxella sp.]
MKRVALTCALGAVLMSGCATSSLLDDTRTTQTQNKRTTLIDDRVVAFGSPAANSGVASSSVVIVGEKQSYVLTEGGTKLVNLLTKLEPKNITVDNALEFYSANNDGKFAGTMKLSYARLQDEFKRSDMQFFIQNGAKECTSESDTRMNAQRFCFDVPLKGAVYPQVSNLDLVRSQFRPLTRPYSVSIYTNTQTTTNSGRTGAEKLVLLPFALAFDVVTLPVQVLGAL